MKYLGHYSTMAPVWPAQDNFLCAKLRQFAKTILKKEYSLTSSLLFKKQLAKRKKIKKIKK
jgi:hypothetical protein